AERSGATLIRRARAIRIDAKLPENLWPEAFITAGYLTNRTPSKQLDWKTPFEILERALNPDTPKQPNIAHLRVYGCRAYPLRYKIPSGPQSLYRPRPREKPAWPAESL